MTLYIQSEENCFQRFQEVHYQKCYALSEIKELLQEAGMEFVVAYDAYTKEPISEESERILVVARECEK